MIKRYLLILILSIPTFIFGTSNSAQPYQESYSHQDSLTVVLEKFKTAIIEKDTTNFKKLFFSDKVPFVGIMSKLTEASIKKDFPDFQGISVSNSSKFIHEISINNKPQEEKSYKPVIETDGNIASISFVYSFHSSKKMIQWGYEKWNLVRVENEWLITDVIFSIHFPEVEPFSLRN